MRTPSVSIESSIAEPSPVMQHASTSPHIRHNIISPPVEESVPCGLPSPAGTSPRTLEGVAVSASVIEELFEV